MNIPQRKHYPKGLWIRGEWWRIQFVSTLIDEDGKELLGLCDYLECLILVRTRQTPSQRFSTFIHEVIHALHPEADENQVLRWEPVYLDFFLRNFFT